MQFPKKYPNILWTKLRLIVRLSIISRTLSWLIIELFELAKFSTRKILLSNYFSSETWKINKGSFLKRKCQFLWKNLQLFWTLYVSFRNNTIKLSNFHYTLDPNQNRRYDALYLRKKSLHIFSKTLKNLATERYVRFSVLSVKRSVVSPSKSFKLLVSKTF